MFRDSLDAEIAPLARMLFTEFERVPKAMRLNAFPIAAAHWESPFRTVSSRFQTNSRFASMQQRCDS
ncbi:hypothetical protein C7S17_7281 [Burkholderia thailandensis]|nr:hypothetical protein [Burkholderia thailandensis]